jgi:hypothetical protein
LKTGELTGCAEHFSKGGIRSSFFIDGKNRQKRIPETKEKSRSGTQTKQPTLTLTAFASLQLTVIRGLISQARATANRLPKPCSVRRELVVGIHRQRRRSILPGFYFRR